MLAYKKNIVFQYGLEFARYFFPFIVIPFLTRTLGADVYAIRAFDDETVGRLLKTKWWELSDERVCCAGDTLADPKRFLEEISL